MVDGKHDGNGLVEISADRATVIKLMVAVIGTVTGTLMLFMAAMAFFGVSPAEGRATEHRLSRVEHHASDVLVHEPPEVKQTRIRRVVDSELAVLEQRVLSLTTQLELLRAEIREYHGRGSP